jgi:hypothetical protein
MARVAVRAARAATLALIGMSTASAARAESVSQAACLHSYEAAQRYRLQNKLRESKKSLSVCQDAACPSALRSDCTTWAREVEAATPTLAVVARSGSNEIREVSVSMDGEEIAGELDKNPIPVDPGEHTFRFEAPGRPPVERKLILKPGEKNRSVELDFPAPAETGRREPPNFVPVYGLAAIGALALGSFTFFAIRSHSRKGDLESCKGHCPVDDVHAVRRDQIVADVSLGIGVVAVGVAAYLYFDKTKNRSSEAPPASAFRFGLRPSRNGALGVFAAEF